MPPAPPVRTLQSAESDEDLDGGRPDPHDDWDYDAGNRDADVLEALMKELENLDRMTGPNLVDALSDLPVPQAGTVPGISVAEAIAVTDHYSIINFNIHNMK